MSPREQRKLSQSQKLMPLETCQEDFRWIQVMNMAAAVEKQVIVQRWWLLTTGILTCLFIKTFSSIAANVLHGHCSCGIPHLPLFRHTRTSHDIHIKKHCVLQIHP